MMVVVKSPKDINKMPRADLAVPLIAFYRMKNAHCTVSALLFSAASYTIPYLTDIS